jgi:hypothetical protein
MREACEKYLETYSKNLGENDHLKDVKNILEKFS